MSKSNNIIGALTNKGTSVFRETFQHSTKDVTHYFPGHMARGEHIHHITSSHGEYRSRPPKASVSEK